MICRNCEQGGHPDHCTPACRASHPLQLSEAERQKLALSYARRTADDTPCSAVLVHGSGGFACALAPCHEGPHRSGALTWLADGLTECPPNCTATHAQLQPSDFADHADHEATEQCTRCYSVDALALCPECGACEQCGCMCAH